MLRLCCKFVEQYNMKRNWVNILRKEKASDEIKRNAVPTTLLSCFRVMFIVANCKQYTCIQVKVVKMHLPFCPKLVYRYEKISALKTGIYMLK